MNNLPHEEGSEEPLTASEKLGYERPLTRAHIEEYFRDWLFQQHGDTQRELRDKRDEQRQMLPIVAALKGLERAKPLLAEYGELCAEVVTLEAKYNQLEEFQLATSEKYGLDFADAKLVLLLQRFLDESPPQEWCIRGG